MKDRMRTALLLGTILVAGVAADAHAWWGGTCRIQCSSGPPYLQTVASQEECCHQVFLCPDGNPAGFMVYEPDEGWPFFCGPYAEFAAPQKPQADGSVHTVPKGR